MPAEDKIVWILGAGFSKPLGGPLLRDLFQPYLATTISDARPEWKSDDVAKAHRLFGDLKATDEGDRRVVRRETWTDAEDFLAVLSEALQGPSTVQGRIALGKVSRAHGSGVAEGDVLPYFREASQYLLRACGFFVPKPTHERIGPFGVHDAYDRFVEHVTASRASILSFNYDCAVEKLFDFLRLKLGVPLPVDVVTKKYDGVALPVLYKLHGSVDWEEHRIDAQRSGVRLASAEHGNTSPCLGVPGRHKSLLSHNLLEPLWTEAEQRLREADVVVVCGYSMPATDLDVRSWIVDQLRQSTSKALTIRTVLPPGNDEVVRTIHRTLREGLRGRKTDLTDRPDAAKAGTKGFVVQHDNEGCESFFARLKHAPWLSAWPQLPGR